MKVFVFRLLFLFLLTVFACKTVKITPPKPQPFSNVEPAKPNSIIGLPINIFTEGIAKSINKKFIGILYKDTSFADNENDKVKYDIIKRADIKVITANNALEIHAPLHINFTYLFKFFGVDKTISNSLNLTVKFTTTPMIDRDWNLVLNSKGKIVWDDLPVINLGITKLDLPNIFGTLIKGFVNKMALKIDKEFPKAVNINNLVSNAWKSLAEPILLDSANKVWLITKPKNLFVTPIVYTPNKMQIKLGLSSVVELVSGVKPVIDSFSDKLPPLRQVSDFKEFTKLNLSASVTYQQMNEGLAKHFLNNPFSLETFDYKVNVLDAQVFNYGNKVLLALKIDGKVRKGFIGKKVKGIIYATGVPIYNPKNKSIEIKQFDFELKTRDVLVKAATWLLNSKEFKQNIENNLVYSIADQLNEARLNANDAVNTKMLDMIDIKGHIKSLEPADIYVTPTALVINIISEGNIEINLNGF